MQRAYETLGQILFWVLLPIERVFIRRTHRVYALIIKDNKVLMIKNWLGDGKWALPGGGVGKHEGAEEALKRELKEELNIVSKHSLKPIKSGKWQNHKFGFKYDIYALKEAPDFSINRKLEITDVAWIDIASLSAGATASDIEALLV